MPAIGPSASTGNAHAQPSDSTTGGTSCMVSVVSRNPSDVWIMSAVPTACDGTLSVTRTLNCAESATTKKPQASATGASSHQLRPNVSPIKREHAPLAASARMTNRSRPMRSATRPPQTHPMPPTAIVAKESKETKEGADDPADEPANERALAARNAGIHVQ